MATDKAIVLLTGVNSGLGFDAAQQLASSGKYHVLAATRSQEKGEAAIKKILAESSQPISPDSLTPITLDVADDKTISAAAEEVKQKYGRLDILINMAGIADGVKEGNTRETWHKVFDVNVFGAAILTDAFLPLIRASKYHDRRIVHVTSGLGLMSMAGGDGFFGPVARSLPVYSSSKATVNMLTVIQGRELQPEGITCVAVSPGFCATPMNNFSGPKSAADGAKAILKAATEGDPAKLAGRYTSDENEWDGW